MKTADTRILYFETGPHNEPTLRIKSGENFKVITQINRGPWLENHPEEQALRKKIRGPNPSSGCIFIEGAEPGDMLRVQIKRITPHESGFTSFGGSNGAMPGWFGASEIGSHSRTVKIKDGYVYWDSKLKIKTQPMLGFLATAPQYETRRNSWGGEWGGNLDVQEVCTGASVYLPVEVPGALLHIGDMHAIQGDGEICGAGGIETSGEALLSCEVLERPKRFRWPRIENRTHICVAANSRPAEEAFHLALQDLIQWLEEEYGFARGDAYLLLGQVLEARVTQFVNPTFTYCVKLAKKYL